jgi:hypothetical protein
MVEADSHLKLLPFSILDKYKVFEHIDMMFVAYGSSLTQLYPHTWLKFGGSESLVESKCCQYILIETQTASLIHIRCIVSV